MTSTSKRPRRPALKTWPDDPTAPAATCPDTPATKGCGATFHTVAIHPETGKKCGRDRCPACGRELPIPTDRHAVYSQWYGLVAHMAKRAYDHSCGQFPYEDAEAAAHDAYTEAILRWVPETARFSTFAVSHIWWRLHRAAQQLMGKPAVILRRDILRCLTEGGMRSDGIDREEFLGITPTSPSAADDAAGAEELREAREAAAAVLDRLPKRTAHVLAMRFGLHGGQPAGLAEIAAAIGTSKERARQIQVDGLERARAILAAKPQHSHGD